MKLLTSQEKTVFRILMGTALFGIIVGLVRHNYFGNNELDLASLYLLNVVSKDFINKYKDYIEVEKGIDERIGIYELYYALLNISNHVQLCEKQYFYFLFLSYLLI